MFQSNKIHDNVLHLNFAPNYIFDVENSNDIENANYSFQFWGNSTQDLKGEHLLAYNNNYVSESISISEWNLFGSSRLGIRSADKTTDVIFLASRNYNWINSTVTNEYIAPTASFIYKKYRLLGAKTFELTNHLGNVITTISDRKLMVEDAQNIGFVHHYKPEILSIGEQYAYGMSMPGRSFSVEDYRYGYNGKENQDELLGEDNAQDFGARMYDARVGRWWGLDPLKKIYTSRSPYEAHGSNPIFYIDAEGSYFTGNIGLVSEVIEKINKMKDSYPKKADIYDKILAAICEMWDDPNIEFYMIDGGSKTFSDDDPVGGTTKYNPKQKRIEITTFSTRHEVDNSEKVKTEFNTIHELCHGYQFLKLKLSYKSNGGINYEDYNLSDEEEAYNWTSMITDGNDPHYPMNDDIRSKYVNERLASRVENPGSSLIKENNEGIKGQMIKAIKDGTVNKRGNLIINSSSLSILNQSLGKTLTPKERCPAYDK